MDLEIKQLDVKIVVLHGDLHENQNLHRATRSIRGERKKVLCISKSTSSNYKLLANDITNLNNL